MYRYLLSVATVLTLGMVLLMPSKAEAQRFRHWGRYPAYGYQSYHVSPYRSYYGYSPYYYGYSPYYYGYSPYYYGYSPYYYRPGGVGFSFYAR